CPLCNALVSPHADLDAARHRTAGCATVGRAVLTLAPSYHNWHSTAYAQQTPLTARGSPSSAYATRRPAGAARQTATVRSASRHSAVGKPPQCGRPTARQPSVPAIVAGWNRAAGRIAAGADGAAAAPAGTGLPG